MIAPRPSEAMFSADKADELVYLLKFLYVRFS